MFRVPGLWLAALALGATGCQTFIGIEDAEGHLPRLDGNYLLTIKRLRADATTDEIKLRGTARLDVPSRSLDLSLNVLRASDGTPFTETSISDITFDQDGVIAPFMLNISIPDDAVSPAQQPADQTLTAAVVFEAEDDYSFCARAMADPRNGLPTVGTVLLSAAGAAVPHDSDCDIPLP